MRREHPPISLCADTDQPSPSPQKHPLDLQQQLCPADVGNEERGLLQRALEGP
ncbi:hypothetical protein J8Z04_03470 [Bombella apis]|uniref:hypothetical protein n=1 Tax=Bombella apis TaxID=1785988 RepID=UPI001BA674BB|nr:hypothetical protein [Bombella apis]MBR9730341.1 hypothetical protein [Bombella apis]